MRPGTAYCSAASQGVGLPPIDKEVRNGPRARGHLRRCQQGANGGAGPRDAERLAAGRHAVGGAVVLHDPNAQKSVAIVIFDSEEDYNKGDEILGSMPTGETPGTRTSVTKYNVATRMKS